MNDYSISGPFGEVVFAPTFNTTDCAVLDKIVYAGWHKVNELYRIDRAEGITNWLILLTVDGVGKAYVGDKRYSLVKNTAFIIPPYVKSGYRASNSGKWEFYWIHIDGENAKAMLSYLTDSCGCLVDMKNGEAVKTMKEVIASKTAVQRSGIFAAKAVSNILFSLLSSAQSDDCENVEIRTSQIADYINDNLDKPFSLKRPVSIFTFRKNT